jgi:5-methylcytosine-specific restriction endonuclease McrA
MQYVFVLDKNKKPLDPCHPARARKLLKSDKAAVFRTYPFTIILKDRDLKNSIVREHRIKIDPGSKTTGMVLVDEENNKVVWAGEIIHRGHQIKKALLSRRMIRRSRRGRKCRYRPARFNNRKNQKKGWLPPSLESRIYNIETWTNRLFRWSPANFISMELVKFDTQLMEDPEISGVEYQQGELQGYEVKEYLLEKWGRKCAYCGKTGVKLETEHIIPKTRGGSNQVSNLTLACHDCNEDKGNKTASEFGYPEIEKTAKKPLKDAAAMNAIRWKLWRRLSEYEVPVECGTGGRTKYNRIKQNLDKERWIDAACVGKYGENIFIPNHLSALNIKAMGNGNRQMCLVNKYGFPRSRPKVSGKIKGFRTGDMAKAVIPKGKYKGTHFGRVVIRASGSFGVGNTDGISHRYCQIVQMADRFNYTRNEDKETLSRA